MADEPSSAGAVKPEATGAPTPAADAKQQGGGPAQADAQADAPAQAAEGGGDGAGAAEGAAPPKSAVAVICIGMAGSGKTSFMQRLNAHLHMAGKVPYVVNLDPAVSNLPFEANIDIRDTVKYKEVMKQYELGPNGGIVTSLNLFATKFDEVIKILEQRQSEHEHIIMDTPGQIEVFTWSASGQIIMETMANTMPTVLVYIIDTPRCISPVTFMSNMLYACSILYKSKLPFVLAFNKVDVVSHKFAIEWMTDYNALMDAISQDTSYMSSLSSSMANVLEEFYQNLRAVGVSAHTGEGMDDFLAAIDEAKAEYHAEYVPLLTRLKADRVVMEEKEKEEALAALRKDMDASGRVVIDDDPQRKMDQLITDGDIPEGEDMTREEVEDMLHKGFMQANQTKR